MEIPSKPIQLQDGAEEALRIVRRLQEAGFIAYFAGGCVRDALLKRNPKDYDVATNATPDSVREVFGKSKTLSYGVSFGVIGVLPDRRSRKHEVSHATEVATFRSDGDYSDGRRPDSVQFGDPEEDALRRDFTINGLFYDPIANQVIDYVGGKADLESQILRTIGDPQARFGEDRLRMLRAIRFSASLGFRIEASTEQAITRHAQAMDVVSEERIGAEMRRVLVAPFVMDGLISLVKTELAKSVIPQLMGIDLHLLSKRVLASKSDDFRFRLAAMISMFHDPSQAILDLTKRWRLSNEEVRTLSTSLRYFAQLLDFQNLPWSQTQPIMVNRDIEFIVDLAAVISASGTALQRTRSREVLGRVQEVLKWKEDQLDPKPLLSGDDLRSLGFTPGPEFARVLKRIRALQLDGELNSKEQAIERAIEAFKKSS